MWRRSWHRHRDQPSYSNLFSENHFDRSSDGGDTWGDLPSGFLNGTRGLAVAPSNGKVLYRIGANGGSPRPERSDDRGETWHAATLPGGAYPSSLTVDPNDENSVWAAVYLYGEGLYHSADDGAHWTEVKGPVGEPVAAIALRFDPTGRVLHVAYPGHGVWELTLDGSASADDVGIDVSTCEGVHELVQSIFDDWQLRRHH